MLTTFKGSTDLVFPLMFPMECLLFVRLSDFYEIDQKIASIQQKIQVKLALNCYYAAILCRKYHTCGI